MKMFIIIVILIVCCANIALGVCFVIKNKKTVKSFKLNDKNVRKEKNGLTMPSTTELSIQFEDIPALNEKENARLVEIRDKKLIARIDGVIPGAVQALANGIAIHKYKKAVQAAGQLYQVVIPKGAALAKAKDGGFRGIYHGNNGIEGHANLLPVDGDMGQELAAMNAVNAVMNVASMIVGQYYMAQVNKRLDSISDGIDKISGFLENEFKSKVYTLVVEVRKCSKFQVETMENDEVRNRELVHLRNLEHECAELLVQVNFALNDFADKSELDYDSYEKNVEEAHKWYQYQKILLAVMGEICELTYVLNCGAASREKCYELYLHHTEQSKETLSKIYEWHQKNISRMEINVESGKRKRQGFDGFLMEIPGLFNEELHYKSICDDVIKKISEQRNAIVTVKAVDDKDLFQEDIRLIVKDERLYFLPPATDI